jgi:hypothetical protein
MEYTKPQRVVLALLDARITRAWVNAQEEVRLGLLEFRCALLDEWRKFANSCKSCACGK